MTNEKIYQLVLKYSYLFEETPNIIDLITKQMNKLWDWEYGGRFKRFTNDDDARFALILFLHRNGYSYEQIMNKIKNSCAIILGRDNEERVSETCSDCEGSGRDDCVICDGGGTVECHECNGTGGIDGEDCDYCDGTGDLDCGECEGDGHVDCRECMGGGDIDNPDKTVIAITTYITFNPVVANYFRENINEVVPEISNAMYDELHRLDESEYTVELKSIYEGMSNYVIDVTSDPKELVDIISDATYNFERNYLWTLTA